jgi:putative ABC transport system ATP-binding protein
MSILIGIFDIRKVFNAEKPNEFVAIQGMSLEIPVGGMTVFKGPSGSGKTTLLSLIGCMTRPTSGRIIVSGREITSLPERYLTEIRRQTFGFVFQQFHLVKGISVLENVMLPAYPSGLGYSVLRDKASGILHLFGLSGKTASNVEWLSGGEAQRVSISRALINDPAVIIADEPTAHLDSKLSLELMEILGALKREGKTILIASHDPLVSESAFVDRVVNIRDGLLKGVDERG